MNAPLPPFDPMTALRVHQLGRRYGSRQVLRDLELHIERGEFVALLGESGCGKTTLLRAVAGLDAIDSGSIERHGRPAIVFQEHRLLPWETLWRNVALGLPDGPLARQRASRALQEVGLGERLEDWPRNLSGGQAQRVALARALVQDPTLLLLDEPFAALDALTRLRMQGLVHQLVDRHQPGVLLVTHDVDEAIALADRILVMRDGLIAVEQRTPGEARRDRRGAAAADLRRTLLAELGVHEEIRAA